MSIWLPDWL